MQTVKKKLSELHKTEKNIRRHSERQIQEYVRSLKMFGQIRPLVVTEDGEILVGNGMYEALTSMGETECDVYVVSGLSQKERRKLMLADNKVYEMGFTNVALLDDILIELDGDFDIPGYDPSLLDTIMSSPSEATSEVSDYGIFNSEPKEEKEVETVSYASAPESPYQAPVQMSDGGFVNPENVSRETSEERKYITCPHCGEKIWV